MQLYFVVGRNVTDTYNDGEVDPETEGYVNQGGLSRKHIFDGMKRSLERLQLEYIDLLQCAGYSPAHLPRHDRMLTQSYRPPFRL
jgi:aryl-alcohol dehydrogenase-like predicted oxidoreductase